MLLIMIQSQFTNQTRIALIMIQIMWTLSCLNHTVSMHAKMDVLLCFTVCMDSFTQLHLHEQTRTHYQVKF